MKRWIKWAILGIAVPVASLVVGAVALVLYASIDKEDAYIFPDATLVDPNYLDWLEDVTRSRVQRREDFPVYAHRIRPGRGSVIAYRSYSNGSLAMIDDESYRKLTLWVPEGVGEGGRWPIGGEGGVKAVYTQGGSAWPRSACAGYIVSGHLDVAKELFGYLVTVEGVFQPRGNVVSRKSCVERGFHSRFEARLQDVSGLTPWLGKASTHPYDETYR